MVHTATIVGAIAAVASTTSFLPQAIMIIRTRDTRSISTGMYAITVAGFALWTSYGALELRWPIVASNGICLALSGFIFAMKLLPPAEKDEVADTLEAIVGEEPPRSGGRRNTSSP